MTQQVRDDIAVLQAKIEYLEIAVIDLLSRMTADQIVEFGTDVALHYAKGQAAAEGSTKPDAYVKERQSYAVSIVSSAEKKRLGRTSLPRPKTT